MDPLPGAKPGVIMRMDGEARTTLGTCNVRDDLEAKEATMSRVFWEIAAVLQTIADVACQRTATHDVGPTRKPDDECKVPKFWPNTVTELLPDRDKG